MSSEREATCNVLVSYSVTSPATYHSLLLLPPLFSPDSCSLSIAQSSPSMAIAIPSADSLKLRLPNSFSNFSTNPKLRVRANPRISVSTCNSASGAGVQPTDITTTAVPGEDRKVGNGSSGSPSPVTPVYLPTPPNRDLRTPHSGYHFDGSTRQFFEGWYFKVSIPEKKQSFCFMYSVENPAFTRKLSPLEEAQYGRRYTGVGAQILGADDKYICHYSEESRNFWASRHELILGNTFTANNSLQPPNRELPPKEFDKRVLEGFQVSPFWHQGFIRDDGRSNYVETVKTARWQYSTRPVYGWGDVGGKQKSTAGWLATFPVFEPHWQICMGGGLSTGWIEWGGERFEFQNAPSYSEKNWGGAFPRKWFWAQCNIFEGATQELALTVGGGLRELPGKNFENAALIGIHYAGVFYEFSPWTGSLEWDIAPWGHWQISADNETYMAEVEATTEDPGTTLRAPTLEAGLAPACKDTCYGTLRLKMWEKRSNGSKGKVILDATSEMAAVEVGGGPWFSSWKGKTTTPELLKRALRVPVDVDSIFGLVPFLKPPGL